MLLLQTVAELGVVIFNALDFGLKVSFTFFHEHWKNVLHFVIFSNYNLLSK